MAESKQTYRIVHGSISAITKASESLESHKTFYIHVNGMVPMIAASKEDIIQLMSSDSLHDFSDFLIVSKKEPFHISEETIALGNKEEDLFYSFLEHNWMTLAEIKLHIL